MQICILDSVSTVELKKVVAEKIAKLDEMKEKVKEFDKDIIQLQAELRK